jgi:hypothetical protein
MEQPNSRHRANVKRKPAWIVADKQIAAVTDFPSFLNNSRLQGTAVAVILKVLIHF